MVSNLNITFENNSELVENVCNIAYKICTVSIGYSDITYIIYGRHWKWCRLHSKRNVIVSRLL